jgi:hypothetical protein
MLGHRYRWRKRIHAGPRNNAARTRGGRLSLRRFAHRNGLSLAIFGLFLLFLSVESVVGTFAYNSERQDHGLAPVSYGQFLLSGRFIESTAENWESEFLEMAFYILLTSFLYQRGSAESKSPDGEEDSEPAPARAGNASPPWPVRRGGWVLKLYAHSLSMALLTLFLIAFVVHATGGVRDYNLSQVEHGRPTVTLLQFLATPEFWFQSFQNWQSEFLGLGTMIVLSIFLRQRGSPESKPVEAPHSQTGKG